MRKVRLHVLLVVVCVSALGCSHMGALRRGPSKEDLQEADRVLSIARLTERRGDASQAQKMYEGLIAEGNALATANHRLGVMAAKNRNFERAWKHFDAAKASGSNTPKLLADIGYARLLAGEFDTAEDMFAEALKQSPNDKRSLNNMAILRGAQGRFSDSLAFSRKAVGPAEAQANLGYLLSQFGDADKAVQHYHLALNQDPSLKVAASALLQIELAKSNEPAVPPEVIATKPKLPKPEAPKPVAEATASVSESSPVEPPITEPPITEAVVTQEEPAAPSPSPPIVMVASEASVAKAIVEKAVKTPPPSVAVNLAEEVKREPKAEAIAVIAEAPATRDLLHYDVLEPETVEVVEESAESPVDVDVATFFAKVEYAQTQDPPQPATDLLSPIEEMVVANVVDRIPTQVESGPRMSSRRRWSRSAFSGEARTISYFAEAAEPKLGFSVAHLPAVDRTEP